MLQSFHGNGITKRKHPIENFSYDSHIGQEKNKEITTTVMSSKFILIIKEKGQKEPQTFIKKL